MVGCHRCGGRSRAGARFCGACGAPLGSARPGVRKTVTVLFADLPPAASDDVETAARDAAARYDRVRAVLEEHGGTVERHAGDAVMAVFGIPSARDDDAQRAVAAGLALQQVHPASVGINTGEVLAGSGEDQELAVGDPVVVASRLQHQAGAGEVLLGPDTARLLGPGARLGPTREVTLRGRTGHLPVVPVLSLGEAPSAQQGPFVGRESERRMLLAAMDRTESSNLAQLVSLLGEAGTGKTRLVREVLRERSDLRVLTGTCRAWGDRSTWRALEEVLRAAVDAPPEAGPADVLDALSRLPHVEPVLPVLGSLLGDGDVPVGGAELAWAVARVLTTVAETDPVVVLLEDLHHGHGPLLDLLPDVVRRLEGSPVLLLALGRPELLEQRPAWGRGLRHVLGLTLRPLTEEQARILAGHLVPHDPDAVDALVTAAGGNPLFLTHLAQARLEGTGEAAPSVAAVLSARLDRLPLESRQVLERAAVVGATGRVEDLRPLCEGETALDLEAELAALVRRDLLELQDGRWAFTSELVREAAEAGLSREERASLHHARGLVLATRGANATAGYHLETAATLLRASDPERSASLGKQAAARLAAAGLRALTGDLVAAADLLGRATSLMAPDEPRRLALLPDLARVLLLQGDLAGAGSLLEDAVVRADALGLAQAGAHARLARLDLLRSTDPVRAYDELPALLAEVLPALEQAHDDRGLSLAHQLTASGLQYRVRWAAMEEPLSKALHHAHRAGDRRLVELAQSLQVGSMFHGPMRLDETRSRLEAMLEERGTSPSHRASVEARLAGTLALQGFTADARLVLVGVQQVFRDLGRELSALATTFMSGPVELLAGDPERAAALLDEAVTGLQAMGDRAFTSTLAALLAEAHWRREDPDAAREAVELSRRTAADGDVISQVRWRSVQAKLLALEGRTTEAVALSRHAVALVATTDELTSQGDVLADAAEVQELVGDPAAGQVLLRDAVQRYERKGAPQAIRLLADRLQVPRSAPLVQVPAPVTAAGAMDRVEVPGPPVVLPGAPASGPAGSATATLSD